MTKEEAIEQMIKEYKRGNEDVYTDFCKGYSCCDNCPLNSEHNGCVNDMVEMLIKRLIKAEEKKETNFDHYVINAIDVTMEDDSEVWRFNFKRGTQIQSFDRNSESVCDWLLEPYKPPKYKLSKFEYDLLDSYCDTTQRIKELWTLKNMQDKGYFKDLSTDIPIKDILANCEVVEE